MSGIDYRDYVDEESEKAAETVCKLWRSIDMSNARERHKAKLKLAIARAIVQAISDVTMEEFSKIRASKD